MEIPAKLRFDFDEMAQLANNDPSEFARRREALIHQLVKRARQPEDLVSLQIWMRCAMVQLRAFDQAKGCTT
jgi:hypothetical protein